MRDWIGSRIRADAETIRCRYCSAGIGEQCIADKESGKLLEAFPAHDMRIRDAQKAVAV
jgi:hypothetical protein